MLHAPMSLSLGNYPLPLLLATTSLKPLTSTDLTGKPLTPAVTSPETVASTLATSRSTASREPASTEASGLESPLLITLEEPSLDLLLSKLTLTFHQFVLALLSANLLVDRAVPTLS